MPETAQFDYAKLPDGSYAKFAKGTSPDVMRQRLTTAGLLKPRQPGPSDAGKEQAKKSPFALTTGIEPTPRGVASWEAGELGGGVADALKSVYQIAKPEESEGMLNAFPGAVQMKKLLQSTAEPLGRVGEVPGAIKDLYKSGVGIPALAMQVPRTVANLATFSKLGKMAGLDHATEQKANLRDVMTNAKAGPLLGSHSRAVDTMNRVDSAAKGIPVDWQPAYKWAQKAIELGKRGFTVPKPVTDFVSWVDSRMKPGLEGAGEPNAMIDRGATTNPLEYQHARDFEVALGAKIPWDQDTGGKMGGLMKRMRESLGQSTAQALKPYNLDTPYLRAKADFTKAYGAEKTWGPFGYFGGKIAGYGIGSAAGHPLLLGYAGGKAGENIAGSLVRSVTGEGK